GLPGVFAGFPLGSLGRFRLRASLGLFTLLCAGLGLVGPLWCRRGRFCRAAAVQALDRFPDPADRRLLVRELLDGCNARNAVPDLHQPVRRPLGIRPARSCWLLKLSPSPASCLLANAVMLFSASIVYVFI